VFFEIEEAGLFSGEFLYDLEVWTEEDTETNNVGFKGNFVVNGSMI